MPEHPQEKTAFLSFPKAGKNVTQWHGSIAVFPNIVIFKPMIEDQVKEQGENSNDGKGM